LVGDTCCFLRHLKAYSSDWQLTTVKKIVDVAKQMNPDAALGTKQESFPELESGSSLLLVLSLASLAFKCRIALEMEVEEGRRGEGEEEREGGEGRLGSGSGWGDLSASFFLRSLAEEAQPTAPWLRSMALKFLRLALRIEPFNWLLWNNLGAVALQDSPKMSQHALIKSIKLNPKVISSI